MRETRYLDHSATGLLLRESPQRRRPEERRKEGGVAAFTRRGELCTPCRFTLHESRPGRYVAVYRFDLLAVVMSGT